MNGSRKWSETRDARFKGNDRDRARYAAGRQRFRERLNRQLQTLAELRRARSFTQEQMAAVMHVSQAQVSRVENQADLYLSTLHTYIEALGGELQIRVAFPGGEWTEVAIGDITGIETLSSNTYIPTMVTVDATVTNATIIGIDFDPAWLVSTVSTELSSDAKGHPSLPVWKMDVSHLAASGVSESPSGQILRKIAGMWVSDTVLLNARSITVEFPYHHHPDLKTRVDWVESTELRVPDDTKDFVACAQFKEG